MSDILEDIKKMNIYEKMQKVKKEISDSELKKSGKNDYSNFGYYELGDIMPAIITLCEKYRLFTKVNFVKDYNTKRVTTETSQTEEKVITGETAHLTIINIDNPDEVVIYSSDMKELELKAANSIQNYGGIQTYSRRYLYMNAFDIVEADMFDAEMNNKKKQTKKEKKILKSLITECSEKYLKLENAKEKKEIGEKLKSLGYTSFSDLLKKDNRKDIINLAEALNVEIPKELEEKETKKKEEKKGEDSK